jgi:hypothetical protein
MMTNEEKLLAITEVLKAHNRPYGGGISDDTAIEAIKAILCDPDELPEGCIIGDDGEIWRTYKT